MLGMVAVVAAPAESDALDELAAQGELAVPIGRVVIAPDLALEAQARGATPSDVVQGAKGVDGGQVLLVDAYQG